MSENDNQKQLPIPLPNGVALRICGGRWSELAVRVHDLKEKNEFSFRTKTLVLRGVDLLVQGDKRNEIVCRKDELILKPAGPESGALKRAWEYIKKNVAGFFCGNKRSCLLCVRGGSLSIDGVRSTSIERVEVESDKSFKTIIEMNVEKPKKPRGSFWLRLKSVGYSLSLLGLLAFMAYLTWLPFAEAEQAIQLYDKLWQVTADAGMPAKTTEVQVNKPLGNSNEPDVRRKEEGSLNVKKPQPVKVEAGATTVTIEHRNNELGKTVHDTSTKRSSTGTGGIASLYFGTACLLYLLFYLFVAFFAVAVFKGMRRHNKMTRNLQSVIDALENEHDKNVRKVMQRKILDDMIDTYLDRPSAED